MKIIKFLVIKFVFLTAFIVLPAVAHKGATGIVKERMDAMKSMSEQMKTLKALIIDAKIYDTKKIIDAATVIKGHAQNTEKQFPKGSLQHPTEAIEKIWQDWPTFKADADKLLKSAEVLILNVKDRAAAKQAFFDMASTCKSCHKVFRKKK